MLTSEQREAMRLYAWLMEEAKQRLFAIEDMAQLEDKIPAALIWEFGFLQLRMLCELVALGCLVAHGDIKAAQTRKLQKEYAADRILAQLEKLHPDFYPRPVRLAEAGPPSRFDYLDKAYLTKSDLLRLYAKCGQELHRGSLHRLRTTNDEIDWKAYANELADWTYKVMDLLKLHSIFLLDGELAILCQMAGSKDGLARVLVAEIMKDHIALDIAAGQ